MRAGHSTHDVWAPMAALACAAASGWLPAPTALLLIVASAGLRGVWPRLGLSVSALGLAVGAAFLAATPDPFGVTPETVAGLRRLVGAFGPGGAAAATVSAHPIRAVAAVAEGAAWGGLAAGEALRVAVWVAAGALAARVPPMVWRALAWTAGVWLGVLLVAMAATRLA